jgi:ubiquinone/menaquinone biosynthesis C-methylase UbiE
MPNVPFTESEARLGRLHDQCEFETKIAARLRAAERPERLKLYGEVYDLYARNFPESLLSSDDSRLKRRVRYEAAFVHKSLPAEAVVIELGPGRCGLSFALARHARQVYGVDVSAIVANQAQVPHNFELILSDGIHIPVADCSIDVVVSNQLMEHLHPDDAADQLREVYRILKPGGSYICITPNRLHGPHDCSGYFQDLPCPVRDRTYVAPGLHLKEYTNRELIRLFQGIGFRHVETWIGAGGHYIRVPVAAVLALEAGLWFVPLRMRKRSRALAGLLGNRLWARKSLGGAGDLAAAF